MTTNTALNLLKSIPCFADFSPETMAWLLDFMVEQPFSKGEVLLLEGESCPGLFVVKSGAVKLYRSSLDGNEQIMRIVHRGGCFDCAPLFDNGPNPVSAQALEASKVYFIPASDFKALVSAHPDVVLQIVPVLATRLRSLLDIVEDFSFQRVYYRLAKLLYQLGEWRGEKLVVSPSLPLSQQNLAYILGCSRQALNSSLQKLAREGIIKIERRRITILKPEVLQEIIYPEITRK